MHLPPQRDEQLKEYATPRQWELAEKFWETGSLTAAAGVLGIHRTTVGESIRTLMQKAAKNGYSPDHDLTHPLPEGYRLRGASTLYNSRTGEPILQWVKSQVDPAAQEEFWRERIKALAEELPRLDPVPPPPDVSGNLMVGYPVCDAHLGMYAWHEETRDDDYDLKIAEDLHHRAMDYLVQSSPSAAKGLVVILGDFFHYDGMAPVTEQSKNQLDSDGRFAKMARVGIRVARRMIDLALRRHREVLLVVDAGNHDPSTAAFLRESLAAMYENEPRLKVERSPSKYHYVRFGLNLIGVHHGDKAKLESLPLLLAQDKPEAWGRTRYRTWWTAHTHRDRVLDVQGTRVESFKTLIPRDAYAAGEGYRSARGMVAVTFHKDFGEVARHTVTPDMLAAPGSACVAASTADREG